MIKKSLQEKFPGAKVRKVLFADYDFKLDFDNKTYHIKILNINRSTILSINSKIIWELNKGKAVGINFKTSSKTLIDMKPFNKLSNKILVFRNKPYKILKFINESEVVDISNSNEIFDILIFNSIKEMTV